MKSWFFVLGALFVCAFVLSSPVYSQNSTQKPTEQTATTPAPLKPQLSVGDLVFTLNTLATVSINGSEVEAYLDVKNTFVKAYEQAQKEKKAETDVVTVEMSVLTANNFLQLFQRASFQGAAAERFMEVKNALYASAPKSQVPVVPVGGSPTPVSTGQK